MKLLFLITCAVVASALDEAVKQAIIDEHNKCRAADGQSTVKWDNDLEKFAQETADRAAQPGVCNAVHRTPKERHEIPGWEGKYAGENLAWAWYSLWSPTSVADQIEFAVKDGCEGWCGEKKLYDIKTNKCTGPDPLGCLHYTQMVWHNSRTIGCGLAACKDVEVTTFILACNYEPGGNIGNRRPFPIPHGSSGLDEAVKQAFIDGHNKCRAADGQSTVKWDNNLEKFAQKTADRMAKNRKWSTGTTKDERRAIPGWEHHYAGENVLAYGSRSSPTNVTVQIDAITNGLQYWCEFKKYYDIKTNTCSVPICEKYKQVVWHDSRTIGCGLASCKVPGVNVLLLVCNYEPGATDGRPFEIPHVDPTIETSTQY